MMVYRVDYRYSEDINWFCTMIPAESDAEAIFDAKSWVNSENATIKNKPKAGNFIEQVFVYRNSELIKVLDF